MIRTIGLVIATTASLFAPAVATAVHLRGEVVRVGFQGGPVAGSGASDLYRIGEWTPILVDLTNDDGDLFEGSLEVRQRDRDGDEVIASWPVSLRGQQTYYLYVPAGEEAIGGNDQWRFAVRVLDARGELMTLYNTSGDPSTLMIPPPGTTPVQPGARLILDMSVRPVLFLHPFATNRTLLHITYTARTSPPQLPDHAAGLAMADTILWDDADPGAFRDPVQLDALLEWTRRGGTLVLTCASTWQNVQRRMRDVLPVRLRGPASMERLPESWQDAITDPGRSLRQSGTLTHIPLTLADLAPDAMPFVPERPEPDEPLLAVRRPLGRGQIVFVAALFRDLPQGSLDNERLFRKLLQIRNQPETSNPTFGMAGLSNAQALELFVERAVGFQTAKEAFLLVAFLFVCGYVLLSTLGSWFWLKRRSKIQHSWTVFSAIAVAASGASVLAVQFIRGIGNNVQELSVVDATAGSDQATAMCYFGLKTAGHTRLDLAVPTNWLEPGGSGAFADLLPMAPNMIDLGTEYYSGSQRYTATAVNGQLEEVPLRATLKQFEASWRGRLNGQIDAQLSRRSETNAFLSADSWIANNLPHDLTDCQLLLAMGDAHADTLDRSNRIYVYQVKTLKKGQRLSIGELARLRREEAIAQARKREPGLDESKVPEYTPSFLSEWQGEWLRSMRVYIDDYRTGNEERKIEVTREDVVNGLLLSTVYSELDRSSQQVRELTNSNVRELDLSNRIGRYQALLVGFSDEPGPARLCWRPGGNSDAAWRPIHPSKARVMYRTLIPVR